MSTKIQSHCQGRMTTWWENKSPHLLLQNWTTHSTLLLRWRYIMLLWHLFCTTISREVSILIGAKKPNKSPWYEH
jgi:hypothetical protein